MAYYGGRGDYYRGAGDPGLFSFLGKAASSVFHFLAPAPIKAAVAAGTAIVTHARGRALAARESAGERGLVTGLVRHRWPGGGRAAATPGAVSRSGGVPDILGGKVSRGFGGHRRHMNVANVKALHRAVRRLLGFRHLVTKVERSLAKLARKHHAPFQRQLTRGRGRGSPLLLKHGDPAGDFYMGDG